MWLFNYILLESAVANAFAVEAAIVVVVVVVVFIAFEIRIVAVVVFGGPVEEAKHRNHKPPHPPPGDRF